MSEHPNLIAQLKTDEGLRLESYRCPTGHWSLGYGRNLEAHPDVDYPAEAGVACTEAQAEHWLMLDVADAELSTLLRWPWMQSLPSGVFEAILNMAFNMGVQTLSTFVNTLAALKAHNFEEAAHNLEQSRWYSQVGNRAKRVVAQVRRGV